MSKQMFCEVQNCPECITSQVGGFSYHRKQQLVELGWTRLNGKVCCRRCKREAEGKNVKWRARVAALKAAENRQTD